MGNKLFTARRVRHGYPHLVFPPHPDSSGVPGLRLTGLCGPDRCLPNAVMRGVPSLPTVAPRSSGITVRHHVAVQVPRSRSADHRPGTSLGEVPVGRGPELYGTNNRGSRMGWPSGPLFTPFPTQNPSAPNAPPTNGRFPLSARGTGTTCMPPSYQSHGAMPSPSGRVSETVPVR